MVESGLGMQTSTDSAFVPAQSGSLIHGIGLQVSLKMLLVYLLGY